MKQERQQKRIRAIKGARAIVSASGSGFDCVIRNISGSGARIEFDEAVPVGRRFQLHITTENKTMMVSTNWQAGKFAGVSFDGRLPWIDRHLNS